MSGSTATIVHVLTKNNGTTSSAVQQNGHHTMLVGKLNSGVNRPPAAAATTTTTTELNSLSTTPHSTSGHAVYPAHYIEAIAEQTAVYAANGENGHVQYQSYAPIIYAPVSAGQAYYQPSGGQVLSSAFTGSAVTAGGAATLGGHASAGHAQLVTHQGATYLVQGSGPLDEDPSALSHTAKASPITVQWLVENYETAEGVSLPRSTLYFHYLQHCNEHKVEPMNPASFGKLIRSVFFGLRTRRLGTRGNSKYHYYGIRIKPTSVLNHFVEDSGFSLRHYPNYHRQTMEAAAEWKSFTNSSSIGRLKSTGSSGISSLHSTTLHQSSSGLASSLHNSVHHLTTSDFNTTQLRSEKPFANSASASYLTNNSNSSANTSLHHQTNAITDDTSGALSSPTASTTGQHQHSQFLGEASSALPNLDEICRSSGLPVPGETDLSNLNAGGDFAMSSVKSKNKSSSSSLDPAFCADLITFCRLYALSASFMLDAVVNLDFAAIEAVWKAFWRTEEVKDSRLKQTLSQERLYELVSDPAVLQFVRLYDHTFYQSLAEVLIPNVLRPIPPTLTQAIRSFAKSLEGWMRQATQGLNATLISLKIAAVSALAQTLRRYTSLNHLAQAARTVLKNTNQINQMLSDLNRVDFNNVQEQASWVCQCSDATVSQLEQDFKRILHKHASLEEWAQWLDSVVTGILQPLEGNSLAYTRAAHQLILKWSFYSSMVIRDLTLRSAASFGSFHLIRLLYDEYIFYLVEHKVAAHLGMTPVAVMGEMGRDLTQQHYTGLQPDLTGKRESKPSTGCTPESYDVSSFNDNDYPPFSSNDMRIKLSNSMAPRSLHEMDEDEEVDEYVDDEDEDVDDSAGDENAMLKHAHASVQAYCRSTIANTTDYTSASVPDTTIAQTNETNLSTNSVLGMVADSPKKDTPELLSEVNVDARSNQEHQEILTEELIVAAAESDVLAEKLESSDSPPPIVTFPNPTRKVVRVTTFLEPNNVASDMTRSAATAADTIGSPIVGSSTCTVRVVPATVATTVNLSRSSVVSSISTISASESNSLVETTVNNDENSGFLYDDDQTGAVVVSSGAKRVKLS